MLPFSYTTSSIIKKTPAVFIDVDGVLKLGTKAIPGAKEAIALLRKKNIPLSILSNGGGETEEARAKKLSRTLNITEPELKFKGSEVFLCHTPMKSLLNKFRDQIVLISGTSDVKSVMTSYGFTKFLTAEEYGIIFPQAFPTFFIIDLLQNCSKQKVLDMVEKRLGMSLRDYPKISAIFQLTDVIKWELNAQLFSDILISPNGVAGTIRAHDAPQKVEYHLGSADLLYKDQFPIPRYASGSFFFALEHLFYLKYQKKIQHTSYGKPSTRFFDYAKLNLFQHHKERTISNCYMIGDNPEVDIQGANKSGFTSILVRTGVFQGKSNCEKYPAKKVVHDVKNAVEYIISNEGL